MRSSKSTIETLVREAIGQKYDSMKDHDVGAAFEGAWVGATASASEDDLTRLLRPITAGRIDVQNQVVVALLIDRYWCRVQLQRPISSIHGAVYGIGDQRALRTTSYVNDYGGEVLTPLTEIPSRLDELERMAETLMPAMVNADIAVQAKFLALMISSIIRVHPFADGNGRAARMYAQYSLRSWGRPFLPLPKVRKDERWRSAMSSAVRGQHNELAAFIERKLQIAKQEAEG